MKMLNEYYYGERTVVEEIVDHVMSKKNAYIKDEDFHKDILQFIKDKWEYAMYTKQQDRHRSLSAEFQEVKAVLGDVKKQTSLIESDMKYQKPFYQRILDDYDYYFKGPKKSKYRDYLLRKAGL